MAGVESSTRFTITVNGQIELPTVQFERIGTTAQLSFADLRDDRFYALDVSTDLQRWTPLEGIWSGSPGCQDLDAGYVASRFYRLRECSFGEDVTPHISIQGTVWHDSGQTAPVAGALISTSLDGQSTLTDLAGGFFLVSDTPAQNGEASYTIEVGNGAQEYSFGPHTWGDQPRAQVFILE